MTSYPLSSVPFDLGFTLLALALFRYAGVLGLLLRMLKKPRVDVLLLLAGAGLLVSVAVHVYASSTVIPLLDQADSAQFEALYMRAMSLRNLSLSLLLVSGLLSATTGWLYYRWISR